MICGDGVINILQQKDADHYERAGEVRTVRGARTGLFVPSRDALFVAVPVHAGGPAEIRFTQRGSRKAIDHDGDAFLRQTVFARFERGMANA